VIEDRDGRYRVIARWRGFPYICVTVGAKKTDASAYHDTLKALRDDGRRDILECIASGEIDLQTVHHCVRDRGARRLTLKDLGVGAHTAPSLKVLYDAGVVWLKLPGTTSPRTGRPFAAGTIERYEDSWGELFLFLKGREASLASLTRDKLDAFADKRIAGGASPSTINRDFTAFYSFFHWIADHRSEFEFNRPRLVKRAEPKYSDQDRHLEPEELERVRSHCPADWWPLFELLYRTGLRITEMQYLQRGDVDLTRGIIRVVDRPANHLKSRTSERQLPLTPRATKIFGVFLANGGTPTGFVFPTQLRHYDDAYRCFEAACIAAGLHDDGAGTADEIATIENRIAASDGKPNVEDVRKLEQLRKRGPQIRATRSLHSLRHTFGVACARAGLHSTVIRDLLGHSTVLTTERYMRYAADATEGRRHAKAIEQALSGNGSRRRKVTPNLPQSTKRGPGGRRPRHPR